MPSTEVVFCDTLVEKYRRYRNKNERVKNTVPNIVCKYSSEKMLLGVLGRERLTTVMR